MSVAKIIHRMTIILDKFGVGQLKIEPSKKLFHEQQEARLDVQHKV